MPEHNDSDRPISGIRFDGGRPCLDFVNTIHNRGSAVPEDYLSSAERYLAWCARAGMFECASATRAGDRILTEARVLREALHTIFSALINSTRVPTAAASTLDAWLHGAWTHRTFDPAAHDRLRWVEDTDGIRPLELLALDSLDFLQHANLRRLRRCAAKQGCGWLFYDETRNGQRRWCSMQTCGALDKMRRYRGRRSHTKNS